MPSQTYTVSEIAAMEIKYRDATAVLTREFFRYKLEHMRRPELWTVAEYMGVGRSQLKRNLTATQSYRRHLSGSTTDHYILLMNYRRNYYEIGKGIAECFKTQDHNTLVQLLNDNSEIRDRRGASEWCDFLNDSDKFPDAPEYDYCSDCDYIEPEHDGSWVYNGDRWICSDCRDNNYRWSDYHDCVVHEDDEEPDHDDDDDDDHDDDRGPIGGYHSSKSKLGLIPTKYSQRKTPVFMGLELEMESVGDTPRSEKAEQLVEEIGNYTDESTGKVHTYALLEEDGSLNHGFEMVTGYTGLDVHAKQLAFFKKPFEGMKSHDTKTCGLHVHICKKGMSMFHAAKLILFMHDSRNQRLFRAIARRDSSRYSQVKNKTADYSWLKHAKSDGMRRLNEDRYESVNFQPERTVEFRLFKGTLRYETIMACLEFTYASWFFTRDTGQQDLTSDNFLKFISQPDNRKDTIYLRSFLRSKGFSLDKQAVVKPNPRMDKQAVSVEV
jgi:hypothetical protein